MTFKVSRYDRDASIIKYILTKPDKYPFLANFYNHSPEMQKFFFERGMIPEKQRSQERNQRGDNARIARDSQSVHASPKLNGQHFLLGR